MNRTIAASLAVSAVLLLSLMPKMAQAQIVTNPTTGSFLASYTGGGTALTQSDLDVKTTQVLFDGTNLTFKATVAGAIGQTTNGVYVFGLDRGAGTARFAIAPNVLFDSAVTIRPDGSITVNPITGGGSVVNFGAGTATISGTSFSATISAGLLQPQGGVTSPTQYTFNLWPRLSSGGGTQPISEFVPNASNTSTPSGNAAITVTTPEASPALLLAFGLPLLGLVGVRRRKSV